MSEMVGIVPELKVLLAYEGVPTISAMGRKRRGQAAVPWKEDCYFLTFVPIFIEESSSKYPIRVGMRSGTHMDGRPDC